MFHDMGLVPAYSSPDLRFEVDGANAARAFMKGHGVPERDIEDVWTSIALYTRRRASRNICARPSPW